MDGSLAERPTCSSSQRGFAEGVPGNASRIDIRGERRWHTAIPGPRYWRIPGKSPFPTSPKLFIRQGPTTQELAHGGRPHLHFRECRRAIRACRNVRPTKPTFRPAIDGQNSQATTLTFGGAAFGRRTRRSPSMEAIPQSAAVFTAGRLRQIPHGPTMRMGDLLPHDPGRPDSSQTSRFFTYCNRAAPGRSLEVQRIFMPTPLTPSARSRLRICSIRCKPRLEGSRDVPRSNMKRDHSVDRRERR